ncbi:MAG: DEAD/DEAH box helicase [Burkholderiales bacterium]|nr:DEAD/DEAH box helicase [Burkholderiales bacterium]
MTKKTFADLGISAAMLEVLTAKGYEEPSKIQELVIPELLLNKSNVIGQAQTGTGKTASFAIPIIENLKNHTKKLSALILTPTRELANQVSDEIHSLCYNKDIKTYPVYGGQSIQLQISNIKRGVDIIVGTPGRVIDLLDRKVLNIKDLEYFVLDEADEMLNMGFVDDIDLILKQCSNKQHMLFFSATMPESIVRIAKKYMGTFKTIKTETNELTTDLTQQIYFEVKDSEKFDTLCRVLDFETNFYGIIFARTKNETDTITSKLKSRGYHAEPLHGDISQPIRNKTLAAFKSQTINILVATDVAARGIDVNNLTHVINYSVPTEPESYVHRIGRTGRAGNKGIAITFITKKDVYLLNRIQKTTKTNIKRQSAPSIKDVVAAKKESLIAFINEIINENDYEEYTALSKNILNDKNPEVVVASMIRHFYGDDLLEKSYPVSQKEEFPKFTDNDNSRLFLAIGKRDGYTPKKLLEFLFSKCNTPARKVKDIQIMDNFSFITVPFAEAEEILKRINTKDNKKPLVSLAKSKK